MEQTLTYIMSSRHQPTNAKIFTNKYVYRWTAVSADNMFQDLPWLWKTADNTERYI